MPIRCHPYSLSHAFYPFHMPPFSFSLSSQTRWDWVRQPRPSPTCTRWPPTSWASGLARAFPQPWPHRSPSSSNNSSRRTQLLRPRHRLLHLRRRLLCLLLLLHQKLQHLPLCQLHHQRQDPRSYLNSSSSGRRRRCTSPAAAPSTHPCSPTVGARSSSLRRCRPSRTGSGRWRTGRQVGTAAAAVVMPASDALDGAAPCR